MLQRWEPVISNSFPNLIPFWVRIHGVGVNGLENLEMCLPLQLPSGEVISVDLEYEKLE